MPYFRYKLHYEGGPEAGEGEYAVTIQPGELIWTSDGRGLRVLDLVEAKEGDYTGLLMVEAA